MVRNPDAREQQRCQRLAEERLKQFRYFTFEPSIDIDDAVLADYLRRAAEIATLSAGARRARALARAREMEMDALASTPEDRALIATTERHSEA